VWCWHLNNSSMRSPLLWSINHSGSLDADVSFSSSDLEIIWPNIMSAVYANSLLSMYVWLSSASTLDLICFGIVGWMSEKLFWTRVDHTKARPFHSLDLLVSALPAPMTMVRLQLDRSTSGYLPARTSNNTGVRRSLLIVWPSHPHNSL
jgi:hypothetical protein